MKNSPLLASVRSIESRTKPSGSDVAEVRLRLPMRSIPDIKAVAAAEGLSMNALFAICIDVVLVERGRKSIDDVAPWFADYLRGGDRLKRHRPDEEPGDDDEPDFT